MENVAINIKYDIMRIMYVSGYTLEQIADHFKEDRLTPDLVVIVLKSYYPELFPDEPTVTPVIEPKITVKIPEVKSTVEKKSSSTLESCILELTKLGFQPLTEDLNSEQKVYRVCYSFTSKAIRNHKIDYLRKKGFTFEKDSKLRYTTDGKSPFYLSIYEV